MSVCEKRSSTEGETAQIHPKESKLPIVKLIGVGLGVLLILAGNFILRSKLEATPLPPYHVFPEDRVPLSWELLLPVDMGEASDDPNYKSTYFWFTTGVTVIKLLEQVFSPNQVYYFLSALLIVCSFTFSWLMFRSVIFSYTLAICMGFGTQFHWLHVCSSLVAHLLFMIYLEANLLCVWKIIQTGARAWKVAFTGSLLVTALCHEQWLDYFGYLTLASLFLLLFARRIQMPEFKPRILYVLLMSWAIAIVYLVIRLSYGRQQYRPGYEAEMIFTYRNPVMALEDFLSNVMTYLYIAFSNYFPPFMISSNSLYQVGADRIIEEQHGYHSAQTHLVVMHHVFYWYFWAGIVCAIYGYYFWRNGKKSLQEGSVYHACFFLAMLLIACGFAVHSVIKYRPYLSVPLLAYKCVVSNLGVALLLSGCLMQLGEWMPRWQRLRMALILFVWGVIVYGAIARPQYLSHLGRLVGLSELPNPRRNLHLPRLPSSPSSNNETVQENR